MLKRIKYRFFKKNPLSPILNDSEYAEVRSLKRFKESKTKLFGNAFSFSDNIGFLHSLEEIFQEQVYKFTSLRNDPFIIDAGANIGLSIIYFKQLYIRAKIVAFEPDPEIYKLLQKNIASFNLDQVELKNAAAWVADTELEFFSEGSLAGSTEVDFVNNSKKYQVKAARLKNWLTNNKVDFLKIDIEGAENSVLFDLESELNTVENLFLEYHALPGKEQMLGEMLNVIKKAGFKYIIKSAAEAVRFPFIDRTKGGFDMQLNIFCFRN